MKDYIYIGEVPLDEPCIQTGSDISYLQRKEVGVFARQLDRTFNPNRNPNVQFKVKSEHGEYYDVQVHYDDTDPESVNIAFKAEGETPEHWDNEALTELDVFGYWNLTGFKRPQNKENNNDSNN